MFIYLSDSSKFPYDVEIHLNLMSPFRLLWNIHNVFISFSEMVSCQGLGSSH